MPEMPPPSGPIDAPIKLDRLKANPFLDGPTEFLVKAMCEEIALVPQFKAIFGDAIAPYMRMDFTVRELPAIRVFNRAWTKEAESWFINGDVTVDVIWPPSIRRTETQNYPDMISAALCQQFRRPTFFESMCARVPGLNELGKTFSVEKSLGFEWQDEIVPLTQITVNFRLDLRQWDLYLESDDRTKDDPFKKTLGDLEAIVATIQALRDGGEEDITVPLTTDQRD